MIAQKTDQGIRGLRNSARCDHRVGESVDSAAMEIQPVRNVRMIAVLLVEQGGDATLWRGLKIEARNVIKNIP